MNGQRRDDVALVVYFAVLGAGLVLMGVLVACGATL